jgi:hypothetical protein
MSSNFIGFLIILFSSLVSVNIIMAVRNEPLLLAWLNQILIGTVVIAVVSYAVVALGTRKPKVKKPEEHK